MGNIEEGFYLSAVVDIEEQEEEMYNEDLYKNVPVIPPSTEEEDFTEDLINFSQ